MLFIMQLLNCEWEQAKLKLTFLHCRFMPFSINTRMLVLAHVEDRTPWKPLRPTYSGRGTTKRRSLIGYVKTREQAVKIHRILLINLYCKTKIEFNDVLPFSFFSLCHLLYSKLVFHIHAYRFFSNWRNGVLSYLNELHVVVICKYISFYIYLSSLKFVLICVCKYV